MLSEENKKDVAELVDVILDRMKRKHLLKKTSDSIYTDISCRLFEFYKRGESDPKIKNALADLKDDLYFNILPYYYKSRYTIENIAELLNCDVSTVVRNKKRLCLSIYVSLQ